MRKVTIFIPIYNASKYLHQCLSSVLSQTYTNLEIILCNDCSKDNSLSICEGYAKKDKRISVVNNEVNLGVVKTRIKCIDFVTGDYFIQIDADDWVDKDYVESMMEVADKYDVDVVQMGQISTLNRWGLFGIKDSYPNVGYFPSEKLEQYNHILTLRVFGNTVSRKAIKTDVIKNSVLQSTDLHYGDDVLFMQNISENIHSVYILPLNKYYYRYGGSVTKYNQKFWNDHCKLYHFRKPYILKHEPSYLHNLTLHLIDTLKDFLKLKMFYIKSANKVSDTRSFIESFYDSEEYKEMIDADTKDEFVELLRTKNTEGILLYVSKRFSRWAWIKNRFYSLVFKTVSFLGI